MKKVIAKIPVRKTVATIRFIFLRISLPTFFLNLYPPSIITKSVRWKLFQKEVIKLPKYGQKAQDKVKKVMHEYKHGELKSGRSEKKVKSRQQAIAIGLSEARKAGGEDPNQK